MENILYQIGELIMTELENSIDDVQYPMNCADPDFFIFTTEDGRSFRLGIEELNK